MADPAKKTFVWRNVLVGAILMGGGHFIQLTVELK